jgi:hypothetical protein
MPRSALFEALVESNRCADETKFGAQLVFQEALIAEM